MDPFDASPIDPPLPRESKHSKRIMQSEEEEGEGFDAHCTQPINGLDQDCIVKIQ